MRTGDEESNKCAEERMRNGLGSAMYTKGASYNEFMKSTEKVR